MTSDANVDQAEIGKFEDIARRWWDVNSEFKPLHDINPLRMSYITDRANVSGKRVLDVGCGGGILTESLARAGAEVTGIDMGKAPLSVAKLHQLESGCDIEYLQTTAEALAREAQSTFDVITCLEMLEHVPDPDSIIEACSVLLKPGGDLFVSTINRNPRSYLLMIVGAEYVLNMLPKGTHRYARFVRPSELASSFRRHGFGLKDLTGMVHNPLTKTYRLGDDVAVNYLAHAVTN